jgi:cation diffusion facilitator family transporter
MPPTRFAWLSIAAAIATIALKLSAWLLTGSVGLLSDALESVVNLVAAIVALIALTIAAKPADEEHAHGHGKAEYFSSGTEGVLIIVAAVAIMVTAVQRFLHPRPLDRLGVGIIVSIVATAINLAVALVLLRAGRRLRSITLEADGQHLMTDVFTTVGVLVGVGVVAWTGLHWLDPVIAIVVALWIVRNGVIIVARTMEGLLDRAVSRDERGKIEQILDDYREQGVHWHALRTRLSGARVFITVHVLVPGEWSVQQGHDLCEKIEARVRGLFETVTVLTHLEPVEDELSYRDQELDRHTRE